MDNGIYKRQNSNHLLKCLVAQRWEYSMAKKADAGKNIATIFLVILSMISSAITNDVLTSISCLFAIVLLIFSRHIDIYKIKHRKHAALIQQYFDVVLFSEAIGQDVMKWGLLPTKTDLAESISKIDDSKLEPLKNWYCDYSELAPAWQVFCCQKENIRWDSRLRTEYKWLVIGVPALVLLALTIIALTMNPSFIKFICVLAWFLPVADYGFSLMRNLQEDIRRIEKLKEQSDEVERLISDNCIEQSYDQLITLQRQIMENRENATLVPDWFYKLRKDKHQESQQRIADTLQNN